MGGYPKKVRFWQPVIEKLQQKPDKWRRYNISRGGRATLCNSILSNPPYHMSTFMIPEKVVKSIGRLMRSFFGKVIRKEN